MATENWNERLHPLQKTYAFVLCESAVYNQSDVAGGHAATGRPDTRTPSLHLRPGAYERGLQVDSLPALSIVIKSAKKELTGSDVGHHGHW